MVNEVNAEIIESENRKLSQKNKFFFRIVVIFMVVFYGVSFSSKIWIPEDYSDIAVTPVGSSVKGTDREVTLLSWKYSENQKKMEIMLGIQNHGYDGIDTYEWKAADRKSGMLEVTPVVESKDFVVLELKKLPQKVTVISLRMYVPADEMDGNTDANTEELKLYADPDRNMEYVDNIKEQTTEDYLQEKYKIEISGYQQRIGTLKKSISEKEEQISNIQEAIEDAESDQKYQTQLEIQESNSEISSMINEQQTLKKEIDKMEEEIQEYYDKIEKTKERISDI